jgi:hypothetical protein
MTKRVIHTQGEAGDSGAERTESLWTPKQTAAYLGVSVKTLYPGITSRKICSPR